jgi:hypothetical protein
MFDKFWKLYPARNGKKIGNGQCKKLFEKLSEGDQGLCIIAVENYAKRQEWPVDPIRFFKSKDYPDGLWKEWVEPEVDNGLEKQGERRNGRVGESFHERDVSEARRIREKTRARLGFSGRGNGLPVVQDRTQILVSGRETDRDNQISNIPTLENIRRDTKF